MTGYIGIFVIVIFVFPAILRWLWNITFPRLFHLPTITYWEAFRIMIIAFLLIGCPLLISHPISAFI